ncbi:MAG: hypothetical protein KatS3mg002_0846 [Candidatus Woesearchaeota archaeon]|nr:MAG: hypothetical protein KatS3mg002_0846 [Candidatus Woesearchaeota archaeon]
MLEINITIFEQNNSKYYFLKYSTKTKVGIRAYKIEETKKMIDNLKESLSYQDNLDMIVIKSEKENFGHEEYNLIGMKKIQSLLSETFPYSKILYIIKN